MFKSPKRLKTTICSNEKLCYLSFSCSQEQSTIFNSCIFKTSWIFQVICFGSASLPPGHQLGICAKETSPTHTMCRAVLQQLQRVYISTDKLLLMLRLMFLNKGIHSCASWEVPSLHCSPRNPRAKETVSFTPCLMSYQHPGLRRHRQPFLHPSYIAPPQLAGSAPATPEICGVTSGLEQGEHQGWSRALSPSAARKVQLAAPAGGV